MAEGKPALLVAELPNVVPAHDWAPVGLLIFNTLFDALVGSTTVGDELVFPPNEVVV